MIFRTILIINDRMVLRWKHTMIAITLQVLEGITDPPIILIRIIRNNVERKNMLIITSNTNSNVPITTITLHCMIIPIIPR
jgi:hypothetical protein